jgi:hypothetical protein
MREGVVDLVQKHQIDITIANGENAAGGIGITRVVAQELLECGVDVLTTGNHVWRQRDALDLVEEERRVLRPANYPPGAPGRGAEVYETSGGHLVGVLSLVGRTFMNAVDCPFRAADGEIESLRGRTPLIVVDMHAEATSEKVAMGWYLDGRVSLVVGTHTHVRTADERILPRGTAYITDVGMTGPRDSVLGMKIDPVIRRFLTALPERFELAEGPVMLNAIIVDVDAETGKAQKIERVLELVGEV